MASIRRLVNFDQSRSSNVSLSLKTGTAPGGPGLSHGPVLMHGRERHRVILDALTHRTALTLQELVEATGGSQATVRRDVAELSRQGRLRKVRGGAEALHDVTRAYPDPFGERAQSVEHWAEKRAIAARAAALCEEGDAVIINGGTTTFQMARALESKRLQVLTNSFAMADHLLRHSACTVFVPSGTVYREQSIILSPFEEDGTAHFRARRMFMGARALSRAGFMEIDALTIQSEQRLMRQADELVVLVDASKFERQSSLILAPLNRASTIITDSRIGPADRAMIADAGVALIVVEPAAVA